MARKQIYIGDMSHETAIGILKLMLEAMETYDGISPTPERINAVKMGIEELKQGSVLDKIKAEIEKQVLKSLTDGDSVDDWFAAVKVNECLEIIDKHKLESEKE